MDAQMTDRRTTAREVTVLEMTWVPVTGADGRARLEMRWHHRRTSAAAAARAA